MYCPIFTTQLVRQCSVRYSGKLNSTRAATQIVAKMLRDSPNEQLVAVLLDTKLTVIGAHVITHGILDASLAHPREIFRPAILANASAVILAHNHPSGELNASRQDYEVFERCKQAGELIGSKEQQAKGLQKQVEGSVQKNVGDAKEVLKDVIDKA